MIVLPYQQPNMTPVFSARLPEHYLNEKRSEQGTSETTSEKPGSRDRRPFENSSGPPGRSSDAAQRKAVRR
jgi:hypothetical protein